MFYQSTNLDRKPAESAVFSNATSATIKRLVSEYQDGTLDLDSPEMCPEFFARKWRVERMRIPIEKTVNFLTSVSVYSAYEGPRTRLWFMEEFATCLIISKRWSIEKAESVMLAFFQRGLGGFGDRSGIIDLETPMIEDLFSTMVQVWQHYRLG